MPASARRADAGRDDPSSGDKEFAYAFGCSTCVTAAFPFAMVVRRGCAGDSLTAHHSTQICVVDV